MHRLYGTRREGTKEPTEQKEPELHAGLKAGATPLVIASHRGSEARQSGAGAALRFMEKRFEVTSDNNATYLISGHKGRCQLA
jgi:hypothetical protein